jgi:hypothetical protein
MNRPKTYTIAAMIQFAVSLIAVVETLIALPQGAAALDSVEGPGYVFTISGLILGLAGLFSAFGVWKNQKWGVILTIVIRAIDGLMALPGVLFAPTLQFKMMASLGVLIAAVVIVLLLWPKAKPAPVSRNA